MPQAPDLASPKLESDYDDEDLFASPEKTAQYPAPSTPEPTPSWHARDDAQETRDAALRKELESVKSVNKVIEGVIANLQKARGNMDTVHGTVQSASTLLSTWTRILSQTEHNQRLILNPIWQGASQDLEDVENEAVMRQQAAERRAAEDQARRDAAVRRAEEEERRKTAAPSSSVRGSRGRGRGVATSRTNSTANPPSNYVGVGGQGGRGRITRVASGIGRGTRGTSTTTRGRGLG